MGGLYEYSFNRSVRIWSDTGTVVCEGNRTSAAAIFDIAPGARIETGTRLNWVNLSGVNLTGATIVGPLTGTNLSASRLDGATIQNASLTVYLDGSSLRDATFEDCRMVESSARGADFTNTVFDQVSCQSFDVTDSNLTREQAATLAGNSTLGYRSLTYRQYSIDDTCRLLGIDRETFGIMAWAGDLQIVTASGETTDGSFDPTCHVPQWEIFRLVNAA
jgi:hypothetical protein